MANTPGTIKRTGMNNAQMYIFYIIVTGKLPLLSSILSSILQATISLCQVYLCRTSSGFLQLCLENALKRKHRHKGHRSEAFLFVYQTLHRNLHCYSIKNPHLLKIARAVNYGKTLHAIICSWPGAYLLERHTWPDPQVVCPCPIQ